MGLADCEVYTVGLIKEQRLVSREEKRGGEKKEKKRGEKREENRREKNVAEYAGV